MSRRARVLLIVTLALLLAGLSAGAVGYKIHQDNAAQERREAAAAAEAARREAERRKAEAEAEAARAAAEAEAAEDAAEVAARHASEAEMESSITKWAREKVEDGLLAGPILSTSCTPVGGGSENLAEVTIKYECLAITEENADGSSRGWPVEATMNFDTGEYTWGLGD